VDGGELVLFIGFCCWFWVLWNNWCLVVLLLCKIVERGG